MSDQPISKSQAKRMATPRGDDAQMLTRDRVEELRATNLAVVQPSKLQERLLSDWLRLDDENRRLREMSTDDELLCLAQIREAIGDDGKLMQSELVERVKAMAQERDAMREAIVDLIVAGEPLPCGGLAMVISKGEYARLREAATPLPPAPPLELRSPLP